MRDVADTIIKPKTDEDFYVIYSSVVDSPVIWGTGAELLADRWAKVDAERLARTDATGSSALWCDPPEHGWQDETVMVREGIEDPMRPPDAFWGTVRRDDLRSFCESARHGVFHPRAGLVTWEVDSDA